MKRLTKLFMSHILCLGMLFGCSQKLNVKLRSNIVFEYGEKLDNSKLFVAKESDEKVSVDKVSGYDTKKIGKQELTIKFTDGDKTVEEKITIEVKDTKKPEVTLKKDGLSITVGDSLDLKSNIKSVNDLIDGDIKYVDKKVDKAGYWIDKGKFDTKKAGSYEVKVIARDVNGNETSKSFKVEVKKKKVVSSTTNTSSKDSSNNGNSSNGAGGSNNGNKPSSNNKENNDSGLSPQQQKNKQFCEAQGGKYNATKNECKTTVSTSPSKPNTGACTHRGLQAIGGRWFTNPDDLDDYAFEYGESHPGTGNAYGGHHCPDCGKWGISNFR